MAEWFEVYNVIRDKCVDPLTGVERENIYKALQEKHPQHSDAIILAAKQRDSIILEHLPAPVVEPIAPEPSAEVAAPVVEPIVP